MLVDLGTEELAARSAEIQDALAAGSRLFSTRLLSHAMAARLATDPDVVERMLRLLLVGSQLKELS